MFNICVSGAGSCGLEGCNASTAIPRAGRYNQGKLGSGILLGNLHLVLWLCKLEPLIGVDLAMMKLFGVL